MKNAQAKAPGKLYIAGEYAVVEPGFPAVIVAVDRFITVSVSPSGTSYGTIDSELLSSHSLRWERTDDHISLESHNDKADILLKTIEITERFLGENGYVLPYYDLTIESSLDSEDGRKYGLGSSGAVTVATISAILEAFGCSFSDDDLFKLAAITHVYLHTKGSFGDIAAATYTGWIVYASMDKKWLMDQLVKMTLTSLLKIDWPKLRIERVSEPTDLLLLVGWTGVPASTESLVSSIAQNQTELTYQDFLIQSKLCVEDLISGIKTNDTKRVVDSIRLNRTLLLQMSQSKEIVLETPLLEKLTHIAEKHGAASKTSGAGGGDCGIALAHSTVQKKQIALEWQANNIEPLALNVYDKSNS